MTRPELTGVAGVPETTLSEALVARLPGNLAPAPWAVEGQALLWLARGGSAAGSALPPGLGVARGLAAVGGFVRYAETPVGTYDEVFGAVGHRTGRSVRGSVTFMAVDSETSLVGGRTNWAMPKTLASFTGGVGSGRTFTAVGADEQSWRVSATPRVIGPAIPYRSRAEVVQQFPDGSLRPSKLTMKARLRPALVTVEVESDGPLAGWLKPGRHLGAVVEGMSFSLAEPTRG